MKTNSTNKLVKHLYIHIPFCNHICSYCDFARIQTDDNNLKNEYVFKIIRELQQSSSYQQYETVYIGGGTPNALDDDSLAYLLKNLQPYLQSDYELSIECNPELVTESNVAIMKKFGVNRISMGIQTTNNTILRQINRYHTIQDAQKAIELFYKYDLKNLSVDFIYNLTNLKFSDLDDAIQFLVNNQIKHVSFYALEIKNGSLMKKLNIQINEENAEEQLEYLVKKLEKNNYIRYEVSNWSLNNQFQCRHNVNAYWKFNEWKGVGFGASGYENWNNYQIKNQILKWEKLNYFDSIKDHEISYLMMNLRLIDGLDLNVEYHQYLFEKYKSKLHFYKIENNHLKPKNISLLNQMILDLFE